MRSVRIAVAALLLALATGSVGAADTPPGYLLRHWDNEDGLPASSATAVARSRGGYMWVGTPNGLARFDGQQFRGAGAGQERLLQNQEISFLAEDARGVLWVGRRGAGLISFQDGRLVAEAIPGREAPVNAIALGRTGALLAAVAGGGVWRRHAGEWRDFGTNGLPSPDVTHLVCDAGGVVWCLAGGRPCFQRENRWVTPDGLSQTNLVFRSLAAAHRGGIWAAANLPPDNRSFWVFRLDEKGVSGQSGSPTLPPGDRSRVTGLAEDVSGTVWLGTYGGGVFYRSPGGEWKRFQETGPLAELIVNCLEADSEGSVWLGMASVGLYRIRPAPVSVLRLPESARQHVALCASASRDGSVWIGTDGAGAFRYHAGAFTRYGSEAGLSDLHVGVLLEDRQGTLWAGTQAGLWRLEDGRFRDAAVPGAQGTLVLSLLEDNQGRLWAGTYAGVARVTGDDPEWFGESKGLAPGAYIALAQDATGRIWAASQGVGLFRQAGIGFEPFARGQWPEEYRVRSLHCDGEGGLWIACYQKGLFQLKDGGFRAWSAADGLPDNGIHAVIEDGAGNLWLASDSGVFACAKSDLENYRRGQDLPLLCRRISVEDGMSSKVCTGFAQPVIARTADGRFWFPNRQALAVFHPDKLRTQAPARLPVVTEVRADGEALAITGGEVRVSAQVRRLAFHYTAPDLIDGGRLQFCYFLQGADKEWVNAEKQRVAYYHHLPPGRYDFQLRVGGPDGQWAAGNRGLVLEIVPQWWQRIDVRALGVLLLAGTVGATGWGVARTRARRKLRQFEMRAELERERRRIAQDLHDELGAGLTQLMLQAEAVRRDPGVPASAQDCAAQIVGHTQQLAATTDEIVWTLNPRNDSLPNLVGYLCDFAQSFLRSSPVRCRLDVTSNLPNLPVNAGERHNLLLAFKEALHNVVRHARATEVWVRVQVEPGLLRVAVEDDGCGFDRQALAGAGNGLTNMHDRLTAVGGTFELDSRPGKGTRIFMRLPLGSTAH